MDQSSFDISFFSKLREVMEMNKMTIPGKQLNIYTVNIESRFILTQTQIKEALGLGYRIISIEYEKDNSTSPIVNVDSAAMTIIQTGYRALARAYHPDLGGDENIMKILNQTKKELIDLIKSL
jgi:hypothetical protein